MLPKIVSAFEKEPEGGSLHAQLAAFRDNLIPDLSAEYFADMYAQTIAYGLFAARSGDQNVYISNSVNGIIIRGRSRPSGRTESMSVRSNSSLLTNSG